MAGCREIERPVTACFRASLVSQFRSYQTLETRSSDRLEFRKFLEEFRFPRERKLGEQRLFSSSQLAELCRCTFQHARYNIAIFKTGMMQAFPADTVAQWAMHSDVTTRGYNWPRPGSVPPLLGRHL